MRPEIDAKNLFFDSFGGEHPHIVISHGRLELLGNHTDHNHGLCLVASASIGITGAFEERQDGYVKVKSEGYPSIEFPISDLSLHPEEKGTTKALIRGVLYALQQAGCKIGSGGFSAALVNDIAAGSGVSSSACFESLIGGIASFLWNDNKIDSLVLAKAGQFSENVYFGKPCGLLDQIGTSFGGINYLDFKSPENPAIEPLEWKLPLDIVLVNPGSSHAKLTGLYASIPSDMKEVAKTLFGKEFLRDVDPKQFFQIVSKPTPGIDERKKFRAQHFFDENVRVLQARKAILENDPGLFLDAVVKSQISSAMFLQNTMVPGAYEGSMQQCVDQASHYLEGGAIRIMGGGFGGSCIAFIPKNASDRFIAAMKQKYGAKAVSKMAILPDGPKAY